VTSALMAWPGLTGGMAFDVFFYVARYSYRNGFCLVFTSWIEQGKLLPLHCSNCTQYRVICTSSSAWLHRLASAADLDEIQPCQSRNATYFTRWTSET
jgi:hypothetical protein